MDTEKTSENPPRFTFIEYNHRRACRKTEAARVEVEYEGRAGWLWMSARDLEKNLEQFGECAELRKALEAYRNAGRKTLPDEVAEGPK